MKKFNDIKPGDYIYVVGTNVSIIKYQVLMIGINGFICDNNGDSHFVIVPMDDRDCSIYSKGSDTVYAGKDSFMEKINEIYNTLKNL